MLLRTLKTGVKIAGACKLFWGDGQFLSSLVKVIVSLRKLVFGLKGRTVQEGRDGPGPWPGQVPGWMAAATGFEFPSDRVGYHAEVLFLYPTRFCWTFLS